MSSDIPHVVSTNDLFHGDLSGDELMEIYNNVDDGMHEILFPDMESSAIDDIVLPGVEPNSAEGCHPGLAMALTAAAIDDALLPTLTEETAPLTPFVAPPVETKEKPTKKRGIRHNVQAPEAKRKAIAPNPAASRPCHKNKSVPQAAALEPHVGTPSTQAVTVPSFCVIQTGEKSKVPTKVEVVSGDNVDDTAKQMEDQTAADFAKPVDTSTEHIRALTSDSWMATCAKTTGAPSVTNKVARQNMSPEERKRQSRDRNREHARNTRLRKKAYVEEIKRTLNELVEQRDTAEAEKRKEAQHEMEQREVRFLVIEEFLKMKGRSEAVATVWATILEDEFELTLPCMEFYNMANGEKTASSEVVLKGSARVMEDAKNFCAFLQRSKHGAKLQFNCDRKNFFMDGCSAFLQWTTNLSGYDGILTSGIMRCTFNPASNKLVSAGLSFDTGALRKQISAVANSSAEAMSGMYVLVPSSQAAVVSPSSPSSSACGGSIVSCDDSLGVRPVVPASTPSH